MFFSSGDEALPVDAEEEGGLSWVEEHFDGNPVGEPTDEASDEGDPDESDVRHRGEIIEENDEGSQE